MTLKAKIFQWGLLSILVALATLFFILLIGEDSPEQPTTLCRFIAIKAVSLIGFLICAKAGNKLYKNIQDNNTHKEEQL